MRIRRPIANKNVFSRFGIVIILRIVGNVSGKLPEVREDRETKN